MKFPLCASAKSVNWRKMKPPGSVYRKILNIFRFILTNLPNAAILGLSADTPDLYPRISPMRFPVVLAPPSSAGRYRRLSVDTLCHRALDRLYERRTAVENLILALERYQRAQGARRASCVDLSVGMRQCSSDSAQ